MLHRGRVQLGLDPAEVDDPEDAGLVFQIYGSEKSAGPVTGHVVAEASPTIAVRDVMHAYRRARVLDTITSLPAIAAVIGAHVTPGLGNWWTSRTTAA